MDILEYLYGEKSSFSKKIDKPNSNSANLFDKYLNWYTFGYLNNPQKWNFLLDSSTLNFELNSFDVINGDGLIWLLYITFLRNLKNKYTKIEIPFNKKHRSIKEKTNLFTEMSILKADIVGSFKSHYQYKNESQSNIYDSNYLNEFHKISATSSLKWKRKFNLNTEIELNELVNKVCRLPGGSYDHIYTKPFIQLVKEFSDNIIRYGGNGYNNGFGYLCFKPLPQKAFKLRLSFCDFGDGFYVRFLQLLNDIEKGRIHKPEKIRKSYLMIKRYIEQEIDKDIPLTVILGFLLRYYIKEDQIIGIYPNFKLLSRQGGYIIFRTSGYIFKLDFTNPTVKDAFDLLDKKDRDELSIFNNDIEFSNLPDPKKFLNLFQKSKITSTPGSNILIEIFLNKRGGFDNY